MKQIWDSFHSSRAASRDVKEVFVPSGGEVTDFSIRNECNIRMADLWGEHALDSDEEVGPGTCKIRAKVIGNGSW